MVSACRQDSHLRPKVILSGIELFPWLRTLYEWKENYEKQNLQDYRGFKEVVVLLENGHARRPKQLIN